MNYEEILQKWEGFIHKVAHTTVTTKPINITIGEDDICNMLRISIWKAIEQYDESRGMSLSSWIMQNIIQGRALIVESNYTKYQQQTKTITLIDEENRLLEIEDTITALPDEVLIQLELKNQLMEYSKRLLKERDYDIACTIIEEKENSDQEIATSLNVDFAIVSDVRLKLKVILCILCDINIVKITSARKAKMLYRAFLPKIIP